MIKRGKHIAVRPDSLIEARYDLTAKQNDILDMVLTQIEDDDNFLYELDIEHYRELYKSDTSNLYRDFKESIKKFEGKGFYLIDNVNNKEIFFVWFSSIRYLDGEGRIVVELGKTLKQLLVKMKKKIFYKIDYPINFNSIYSKRIYYYLMSFKDTGWRIDNLDELRKKLRCPDSYKKYGLFRRYVLDKAYDEINNFSDISFNYSEIKTKRKVTAIKFYIHSKNNVQREITATREPLEGQIAINLDEDESFTFVKRLFRLEQLSDEDVNKILEVADGDIEKIKKAYSAFIGSAQTQNINNVVGWIIKAIQDDWSPVRSKDRQSPKKGIHNFKQRDDWNFEELERLEQQYQEKKLKISSTTD